VVEVRVEPLAYEAMLSALEAFMRSTVVVVVTLGLGDGQGRRPNRKVQRRAGLYADD